MPAYYNEIDPYAAQWLRNLIVAGHIAPGDVDERDIRDVSPNDLSGYEQVHFFAGIGGWSLALRMAGWPDDRPVWTGSCPCQPFSSASRGRGKGFNNDKDLWPVALQLIQSVQPQTFMGEQVATGSGLIWFDRTSSDLKLLGYSVREARLCASTVRLPRRDRLYFSAHADNESQRPSPFDAEVAGIQAAPRLAPGEPRDPGRLGSPSDGVPSRVGRLRAYGNAIVPPLAAQFIAALMQTSAPGGSPAR
jgi:DNA (cytosine-5)-methyltransferase 1